MPEIEGCFTVWQHFEISRHSRSYTDILRGIWDRPSEVFDETFEIPILMEITEEISKYYDDTFIKVNDYNFKILNKIKISETEMFELKKSIIRFFINVNILEGIRFYSGFLTIWAMHYSQGLMERTSKILQLICRDENLHLAITQQLLKILRNNKDEQFIEAYEAVKPEIPEMYLTAFNQELKWIQEVFKEGSFLGMNLEIAETYLKYITNRRLKAIQENIIFPGFDKNPCEWSQKYINMNLNENLPQESEILNYRSDLINLDISDNEIENLKNLIKF